MKIGTNHGLYAANVTSDASVGDAHLAQRLWGLGVQNHSKTPAEDLGISYVAQLELEQIVDHDQLHTSLNKSSRLTPQQTVCGQLAALGFPLVGDSVHGGGTSEVWGHRHGWNRLALQCCEWSFPQPFWHKVAEKNGKKEESVKDEEKEAEQAKEAPKENEATEEKVKETEETKEEKKEDDEAKEETKDKAAAAEGEEGWTTISNGKKSPAAHANNHQQQDHGHNAKSQLHSSREDRCVFRLNEAWWNPLLDQYHVDGFWVSGVATQ